MILVVSLVRYGYYVADVKSRICSCECIVVFNYSFNIFASCFSVDLIVYHQS
jgi:hypothetical protein